MANLIQGLDPSGLPRTIGATDDGRLKTAGGEEAGPDDLLAELIWEIRALRRVQCAAHDKLFEEYPG